MSDRSAKFYTNVADVDQAAANIMMASVCDEYGSVEAFQVAVHNLARLAYAGMATMPKRVPADDAALRQAAQAWAQQSLMMDLHVKGLMKGTVCCVWMGEPDLNNPAAKQLLGGFVGGRGRADRRWGA